MHFRLRNLHAPQGEAVPLLDDDDDDDAMGKGCMRDMMLGIFRAYMILKGVVRQGQGVGGQWSSLIGNGMGDIKGGM